MQSQSFSCKEICPEHLVRCQSPHWYERRSNPGSEGISFHNHRQKNSEFNCVWRTSLDQRDEGQEKFNALRKAISEGRHEDYLQLKEDPHPWVRRRNRY